MDSLCPTHLVAKEGKPLERSARRYVKKVKVFEAGEQALEFWGWVNIGKDGEGARREVLSR